MKGNHGIGYKLSGPKETAFAIILHIEKQTEMEIPLLSMGNFKGMHLPAALLEKYSITDTVELILEGEYIF